MSEKKIITIVFIIIFIFQIQSFALYNLNAHEPDQINKNNVTTIDSVNQVTDDQESANDDLSNKHEINNDMNLNSLTKVSSLGSLFVTGTQVLHLSDQVYDNIYISDTAQVYLDNVTVSGDIEVHNYAYANIANNSWSNRLLMYESSNVLMSNINNYGSVTTSDFSSLTLSSSYLNSNSFNFYGNSSFQMSQVVFYCCGSFSFNDNSTAIFTNDTLYYSYIYLYYYSNVMMTDILTRDSVYIYVNDYAHGTFTNIVGDPTYFDYNSGSLYIAPYSQGGVTIINSKITDLNAYAYDYSLMQVLVQNSIITRTTNLHGNINFTAEFTTFQGNIYSFGDDKYSNSSFPKLLFTQSGNITLTKETSGSSQYRSMADSLTLIHTNASIMFFHADTLILQNYNYIFNIQSTFGTINDLDGTSTISTSQTILIDGDYIIGGSDVISLSDSSYNSIYIFDTAQVYLDNVTVSGDIEVHNYAYANIANNSWSNRLLMYESSNVLMSNINNYGSVTTSDFSSLTLSSSYLNSNSFNFYGNSSFQMSQVVFYCCGSFSFNDNSTAIFTNDTLYYSYIYLYYYSNVMMTDILTRDSVYIYVNDYAHGTFTNIVGDPTYFDYNSGSLYIAPYSQGGVTIINSKITDLNAYAYDYSLMQVLVQNSIITRTTNLHGNINFTAEFTTFQGNIYSFGDDKYSNSSFPKLLFTQSGNITLTKETSGSSQYRSMADSLTLIHTNATIIFIYVDKLSGYQSPYIQLISASYGTLYSDGSIVWDGGTSTTNHPPTVSMIYPLQDNTVSNQITVSWSASDPDGNILTFDLYVQAQGSTSWTSLAGNLNTPSYEWDSATVSDGQYRFKIVATDELGLSTELISNYFYVDNVDDNSSSPTTTPSITTTPSSTTSQKSLTLTTSPGFSIEPLILLLCISSLIIINKRRK